MLWRIPGLSEHFICFNDDLFLLQPVMVGDFFEDGAPIANGYWHMTFTARLLHTLRRRKNHYSYLSPAHHTLSEVRALLDSFDADKGNLFCCINSLDAAGKEVVDVIVEWLDRKFAIVKPG